MYNSKNAVATLQAMEKGGRCCTQDSLHRLMLANMTECEQNTSFPPEDILLHGATRPDTHTKHSYNLSYTAKRPVLSVALVYVM